MKLLLDTHVLVWLHTNDVRLSQKARSLISDISNTVFYSPVTIWESEIKHSLHPEDFPFSGKRLDELSRAADIIFLPLLPKQIALLSSLQYSREAMRPHKDPFDRMLICQAKSEGMLFLTHDELIPYYSEPCVVAV
ncbi:MAG: type II toxin-antitoxin system VapC family toxin [Treponema sp.]|nr:type II toxin-antitoxin system VapC family toxin [Treponema sp.]